MSRSFHPCPIIGREEAKTTLQFTFSSKGPQQSKDEDSAGSDRHHPPGRNVIMSEKGGDAESDHEAHRHRPAVASHAVVAEQTLTRFMRAGYVIIRLTRELTNDPSNADFSTLVVLWFSPAVPSHHHRKPAQRSRAQLTRYDPVRPGTTRVFQRAEGTPHTSIAALLGTSREPHHVRRGICRSR
jgi:hypothetical protein